MSGLQVANPPRLTQQDLMKLVRRTHQGDEAARQALWLHWYKLAPKAARMVSAADVSPPVLHELSIEAVIDTVELAARGEIHSNPDAVYFQNLVGKVGSLRAHEKVKQRLVERARAGDPAALAWSSARTDEGKATLRSRVRMALRALVPADRQLLTLVKGEKRSVADAAELMGINPNTAASRLGPACDRFLKQLGEKDEESSP